MRLIAKIGLDRFSAHDVLNLLPEPGRLSVLGQGGCVTDTVELGHLDTRYEHLRLKDQGREYAIQSSILEQGILEPLCVIALSDAERVLLDGYKRYRCAVRLRLSSIPVMTWEDDVAVGILKLLRFSSGNRLSAVEEAGLINELYEVHQLSMVEIARRLERSVSWVSLRLGLLQDMGGDVRERIFSGEFPVRSYMYSLRHFTRVKSGIPKEAVSAFVGCVAGHGLSGRDIARLAQAYFKGDAVMKSQIEKGQLDWTLRQLREGDARQEKQCDNLSELESRVLSQLDAVCACSVKLSYGLKDTRLASNDFFAYGSEVARKVLKDWDGFHRTLREFYDSARAKRDGHIAASVGKA